jgi:hypothetical protein
LKDITIGERKFTFEVPNPWDGCAIFNMVTNYDMPFNMGSIFGVKAARSTLPPDQLEVIMKLCLKYCIEEQGNDIRVVDEDGGIGIIGATAPMLTKLTAQYLIFFTEYWLGEIG